MLAVRLYEVDRDGVIVELLESLTMPHAPRVGDSLRLYGPRYYAVAAVVWCLDEPSVGNGQRVNLGLQPILDPDLARERRRLTRENLAAIGVPGAEDKA